MKNIKKNLLVLIIMINTVSFSQIGIGKFKLGTNLNQYEELINAKKVIKPSDYGFNVENVKGYRWGEVPVEMIADTNDVKIPSGMLVMEGSFSYILTALYGGSYFPNTRNFYIGTLKINEELTLHAIKLYFYDNKLCKIEVNENDLTEVLTFKYGEPKEDIKTKKVLFTNMLGTTIEKEEITKTYEWNVESQKIYTKVYNKYSDKGENSNHKYTCIIDPQYEIMELIMIKYHSDKYEKLKIKEEKIKKEKMLKDF